MVRYTLTTTNPPGRAAWTHCSFLRCCGGHSTDMSKLWTSVAVVSARHAMPVPPLEAFSDLSLWRAGERVTSYHFLRIRDGCSSCRGAVHL